MSKPKLSAPARAFASSIAARSVHSAAPALFVPPVSHSPLPGVASVPSPVELTTMPLAGTIAWSLVAVAGATLPLGLAVWALFILTGSIAYLGIVLSRFTGEDLTAKDRPKNSFDRLFFLTVFQALLVYSIAIPFFLQDATSLPMTVGILSGLMWAPLSWVIEHWIGLFHAIFRTGTVRQGPRRISG